MYSKQGLRDTIRDTLELLKRFPPSNDRDVNISVGEAFLRGGHVDAVEVLEWMQAIRSIIEDRIKKRKTV
jgi:hypothetical protein